MTFDLDDFTSIEDEELLEALVLHEMGHTIGIGYRQKRRGGGYFFVLIVGQPFIRESSNSDKFASLSQLRNSLFSKSNLNPSFEPSGGLSSQTPHVSS